MDKQECKHEWQVNVTGYRRHKECTKCSCMEFVPVWQKPIWWIYGILNDRLKK